MTMLPRLSINKALLFLSIMNTSLFAQKVCTNNFKVLVKSKKDYSFQTRELKDMFCEKTFEGKFFKVVQGTSNDPISFDGNIELVKKAANVYYHLTQARNYWVNELENDYVKNLEQLTIRLNITNSYSKTRHYKHENHTKNFNNAWSTPEGKTPRFIKEKKTWGQEIWFSPMKKFETRKNVKSIGNNPVHQGLKLLKEPIVDYQGNALLYGGLGVIASPTFGTTYLNKSIERLAVIAGLYGLVEVSKYLDKPFTEKYYFIDTALVPDIIYHEFSHIALSDTMKTVHSVPVIEGVADYFAARISQTKDKQIYKKIKNISSNKTKKLKNRTFYHPALEQSWNATSDFTLSLLWNTRLNFNKVNESRKKKKKDSLANFDKILYQAHFELHEESTILEDLTKALVNECIENCKSKRLGLQVLNRSFEQKGLN